MERDKTIKLSYEYILYSHKQNIQNNDERYKRYYVANSKLIINLYERRLYTMNNSKEAVKEGVTERIQSFMLMFIIPSTIVLLGHLILT